MSFSAYFGHWVYFGLSSNRSLVICSLFWGKLVGKPDIDVSVHLQKIDMELRDRP